MTLSTEQIEAIASEEESRWREVHAAIIGEHSRAGSNAISDQKLARELTAELVTSRSVEDKVQLASDEAVAHGLSKLRRGITKDFGRMAKQPYFARVITEEDGKEVEFFLGTSSFPKHRIVDWRKAPISQLYYNYNEGDEFDELIQDRERYGRIKLRRGYKGAYGELQAIELPEGIIRKKDDGRWHFEERKNIVSRSAGHDGHLPPILSLITKSQFELITHAPKKPIVIQGIAGSGKTTVALHRLAWLLHEDNSDIKAANSMVIVFNRALKKYIETTLPELEIKGVQIRTYHQWLSAIAKTFGGGWPYDEFTRTSEVEQFKSSPVILAEVNNYVMANENFTGTDFKKDLFGFYDYLSKKEIFWPKWKTIREDIASQVKGGLRSQIDDAVMLNLVFARNGQYPCPAGTPLALLDHIVIDEAQDFGVVEIRSMLNALNAERTVTIVGDIAQKIVMNRHFTSWKELLTEAGFEDTTPIELNVSHRSTEQVMKVAFHLRNDIDISKNKPTTVRYGPEPAIMMSGDFDTQPLLIGKWIKERIEENPHALSAVICRWPKQAEKLTEILKKTGFPFVRWGHRENFDFSPGITITNVNQVKGLEFRNVLIVNPTEAQYSAGSDEERNLLYVAVTRTEVRLDFISKDKPTSMLPFLLRANAL